MAKLIISIVCVINLLSFVPAFCLEPLSEDELYDTSGQAGPEITLDNANDPTRPRETRDDNIYHNPNVIYDKSTSWSPELQTSVFNRVPLVTVKFSDGHVVDYFNQNAVLFGSPGYVPTSLEKAYYRTPGPEGDPKAQYVTLVWPEPIEVFVEFDKYPNFPNGLGVSVTDIMRTDATGRPLPQYYNPTAPLGALPPNTNYIRTKPAAATVTINNTYYIGLTGDKNGEPDWDAEKKLLYLHQSGTQRTEILGYIYVWTHKNPWEPTE